MRNKLFKRIRWPCGTPVYVSADRPTGLPFILSYMVVGGRRRPVGIPARSAGADKAQALYLFRQLNAGPIKGNRFRPIYCPVTPQTALYSPLA